MCTQKINEVPELNPVAHHISKLMELIHGQQKQTECDNLDRRRTSPGPFQNSQKWHATFVSFSSSSSSFFVSIFAHFFLCLKGIIESL